MREPTISVAMATYNGERFLQEQLDSLARQTLLPHELVACDDCSTDGTLDILHRFAGRAPFPLRIYRNETRLGHGQNFLRAASLCSGNLIAFCDQDDVWLEHKLQRCAETASEAGCVLVIHSAQVVDEHLVSMGFRTPNIRQPELLDPAAGKYWRGVIRPLAPGFACVFSSGLLTRVPPGPPLSGPSRGHEPWLFFAAEATGSIALLPDVLALYRQHGCNTVGFHAPISWVQRFGIAAGRDESQYLMEAETATDRAELFADTSERCPDLRLRLAKAREWYEARAKSLAFRASLYACGTSRWSSLRRLVSIALAGAYGPRSRAGAGLRTLAKDLGVILLPRGVRDEYGRPGDHVVSN